MLGKHLVLILADQMSETLILEIAKENDQGEAFVLCLALGTLRAIKNGVLASDAGTWTLGRPIFWEPLERDGIVSQDVLGVLKSADEFGAIRKLSGEAAFQAALGRSLTVLEERLRQIGEASWYASVSHNEEG